MCRSILATRQALLCRIGFGDYSPAKVRHDHYAVKCTRSGGDPAVESEMDYSGADFTPHSTRRHSLDIARLRLLSECSREGNSQKAECSPPAEHMHEVNLPEVNKVNMRT